MAIVMGIDPGFHTGIAVVDTTAKPNGKVLWHKTVTGGWKERLKISWSIHEAEKVAEDKWYESPTRNFPVIAIIQLPTAKKMAFFKRKGKDGKEVKTPATVAKNALVAGYCVNQLDNSVLEVHLVESQSQRGKGMKMDKDLFNKLHPEAGNTSEHVRDAAIMALGYNEIGV